MRALRWLNEEVPTRRWIVLVLLAGNAVNAAEDGEWWFFAALAAGVLFGLALGLRHRQENGHA